MVRRRARTVGQGGCPYSGREGDEVTVTDEGTTLSDLRRAVAEFVTARDWEQFHTPKHLSAAVAIEAAELMEQFQWLDDQDAAAAIADRDGPAAVIDELADILIYGLSLANALGVCVSATTLDKLERNERRFPVEAGRGRTVLSGDGGTPG